MVKILKENKNFRLLWFGQLTAAFGDRLTQMGVLTFLMVTGSDNGSMMAVVTFFSLLPYLLFGPLFGAFADRYSRKKLMLIADLARMFLVAAVPLVWAHTQSVLLVAVFIFLLGALSALFAPAKMSIITNITDKDVLLPANSLMATTGMVATLVGTIFAGALIGVSGIVPAFYINALTYLISAVCIFAIAYRRPRPDGGRVSGVYRTLRNDIMSGIRYSKRHALLLRLTRLSGVFALVSGFSYVLILNYGVRFLNLGSLGCGGLLSAAGLGMIAGSAALVRRQVPYKQVLYAAFFIAGISSCAFIARPSLGLSLAILFCGGFGAAIISVTLDTLFQRATPNELRGKVFAARGLITNGIFLIALLAAGAIIKFIAAPVVFLGIGVIAIITAARIYLYQQRWAYHVLRAILIAIMRYWFAFRVSGLEHLPRGKTVVLAGNHTSLLDGVALMCAYPERIYFLAEESVFRRGLLGAWFRRLQFIPLKRGGFNKESIQRAVSLLRGGFSVGIFPEGKIACDGRLAQGKGGVAVIAKLAGVSIVPFAIEGAHEAWPLGKRFPRGFPVEVRFAPAIDARDYPAPEALLHEVMEHIAQTKLALEREGYVRVDPDDIIKRLINF